MVTEGSDSRGLHLPDLVVKGFRGIEDLTVSRLGRGEPDFGEERGGEDVAARRCSGVRGAGRLLRCSQIAYLRTRMRKLSEGLTKINEFFDDHIESSLL